MCFTCKLVIGSVAKRSKTPAFVGNMAVLLVVKR